MSNAVHSGVVHEHERFGTLTFDARLGSYDAKPRWNDVEIRLRLEAAEDADLEAALKVATELWSDQAAWNRRIRDFAVGKLLPLKNRTWLDEDEEPLTPAGFDARMTLEAVSVSPDGGFTFTHADGDLFWGHAIQVSGNLKDGPTHADIPG